MGKFSEMDILLQESYDRGFKAGFNEAKEASEKIVKDVLESEKGISAGIRIRLEK